MKLKSLLTMLAAAVGLTTAATAATPVAVWDGDFNEAKTGYTLNANGNTVAEDGSTITIADTATKGVTVDFNSGIGPGVTVLVRYSDLDFTTATTKTLASVKASSVDDRIGVYAVASAKKFHGIWQGSDYGSDSAAATVACESGTMALTYKHDDATYLYYLSDGVRTQLYGNSSLKSKSDASIQGVAIGGPRATTNFGAAKGMTIQAIAVFSGVLTESEMATYIWPSEKTTYKSVLSLNFGASTYNVGSGTTPDAFVDDSNWYNYNNGTGTDSAGDVAVIYKSSGNYQNGGKAVNYLKGYLDDYSNYKTAVEVAVSNLTGVAYDVYIYCSSDNASGWSYKTVNGKNYYALSSGEATVGTSTWGNNTAIGSILGSNVMVIKGVTPDENGKIAISSVRNGLYRGCIAAVQLGELENVVVKDFALTLDDDGAAWQTADWDPEIPEEGMAADATATITVDAASPTLTLDGEITVGTLKVVSETGKMLVVKKDPAATTSFGVLDVSEATDGTAWDGRENTFTACSALRTAARDVNNKFYFYGNGDNGSVVDFGTAAYDNNTIKGHFIFDGGVHTFQKISESAALQFAANATVDNPTFWVKDNTVLNWKARNPCGWNATASDAGIVRIGNGATVKPLNADANAGTWYWSQQFYLENGATLEIGTTGDNFRTVGNDSTKPHFVVPENATATIAGGESNYLALPANDGGAAVFDVGEDSTLTVSANLKTLANGKPFVKYGAGTLKLTGDVANFAAAIQAKAGTLIIDKWATLNKNATIAVDEGATYQIVADEDVTFPVAMTGTGAVTKDGAGTLSVTPGQFGDNLVTIGDGALKFTLTDAQAKAGVVLCQTADDITGSIVIVNEAGDELSGDFTKEGNALSFKANCVDLYITVDSSGLDWGDVREELGWIDSPESTLVITNDSPETADAWLDFSAGIVAKSIKIVHVDEGADTYIFADSFKYMTIGSYDFTEAPDVFIDFADSVHREMQLVTGTPIAGIENVKAANLGSKVTEFGLYTDATHIWLCRKIDDVTRVSPVTGEVQSFTNFFVGVNYGYGWIADWADKSNWRTAVDGLLAPYQYEKYPQSSEAQNSNWYPACFDGDIIDKYYGYKDITCETVEGWNTKLDFRNGVNVTIDRQKKFANTFMWIDETSSVTIEKVGGSSTQYGYVFDVAGSLKIGEIEQSQPITFTYNLGENATVTYTNGVKYGTHALNGGKLIAEGAGISVPVTVTNDVTIATPAVGKITINPESTLTLESTAEGDLLIGDFTNNGTFEVSAGNVVFKPGVTTGTVQTSGTGMVFFGFTVDINDCGKFTPPEGYTVDNVRLFDAGGNLISSTIVGDHLEYEWDVTGKNCWWDYEFNGNVTSVGTDTGTMANEGTTPYYNEDETALRVGYGTPYRGASYPENFTAVIYGKMVNTSGHMEIGFGSTTSGTKYGVVIACGDPAKNEVNLHITSGTSIVTTVPMTVTDPYDTDHLYAFTCQTVDEKTKVSVYLDGKFLQAYTFGSKITLGSGFQVGSIHGGGLSGCIKATTANDHAELDFLRVYQTVLTAEAMTKYAEKYPYTSKSGSSVRTFDDSLDQTWVAAEADKVWTVTPFGGEASTTNIALAGSMVTVSASATAEVTMNLDAATTYESLTIGEGSDITLKTGDEAVEPTITGITSIKANVTVDYDAIKIGTVEVEAEKTLTFDFTDFPFSSYYASATIAYTGATSGEGTITAKGLPTEGVRTVTFEKNASTDQYELKIVIDAPFVYTIAEGEETGTWTLGVDGEEVTQEIVDANPKAAIWKKGDGSWTNDITRAITVKEGDLVAASAGTATVTVDGMTTFDFNGKYDGYITVNLNGGSLVNNGGVMGAGNRQLYGIALTEDSTVGGTGNFGLVSGGYGANTLDLGGKSLTKTGDNTFWLCHTTITNGTFNVTAGTIQVVNYETTFTDDAKLVLSQGTTLNVGDKLNIAAITADGATINNTYTTKPLAFTLTGSATLTGNGNWGTNTLANGASVTVGTNHALTFAGAGTVNATLTADEFNAGEATLFTRADGASTVLGTIMYGGKDITDKCTISDNKITAIEREAKIGTTYYLTLAEALSAAQADETVTLLKNVAVASLTVPEDVTLDPTADYTITVDPKTVVNNGTIVVYDIGTATALKDLDGTLKAGADLDATPAMFYPQGTEVAHSTEVVESAEHTNNVPTLYVTVPSETTVIWGQGVNSYQKMYVMGDAEFAGNISAGWDTNKLQTVFYAYGALKLNSDVNIGKYALASVISDALDLNGKAFILNDTDAILTTSTNLVAGVDVTTDKEGYEVKMTESGLYYYYTIEKPATCTFTLTPEITGTTVKVYTNDTVEVTKGESGYTVLKDAEVKIVYTADQGKLFADGTDTKTLTKTISASGEISVSGEVDTPTDAKAKIGDVYYLTLQAAFDVAEEGIDTDVVLVADTAEKDVTVKADQYIMLYLNNHTLTADGQGIDNYGMLNIYGGNPVELKGTGAIVAREGAVNVYSNSVTVIESGIFTSTDNAVVMGNGREGQGIAGLYINGGTFNGGIKTAGYIACGVYIPNASGMDYGISGGTFNITNGCGVCARAGTTYIGEDVTFNLVNEGEVKGWVGDKKSEVPGVDVYFDWTVPEYPGYEEGDTIYSAVNTLTTSSDQEWSAEPAYGYYTLQKKPTTYTITITEPTNGTLETSVTNNIVAGTTVTVTATPAQGYELVSITTNGTAITGTTFDMPAEDVTVAATFKIKVFTVTFSTNGVDNVVADFTLDNVPFNEVLSEYQVPQFAPFVGGAWDVNPIGAVIVCNTNFNYTIKAAGPTPAAGSDTKVTPVAGEENTYKLEPTGSGTTVAVDNVKEGDILVVDATVTAIGVQEGEQSGAIIKVRNSGDTAYIPNEAMYGWDGNSFGTALDPDKEVEVGEETIPVTPAVDADAETPVGVTDTQASVAMRTIPGLTYQLIRGDEPGVIETPLTTEGAVKTATGVDTTLVDTAKPDGKAFYKVQVTK